jgi:hypothetical protein
MASQNEIDQVWEKGKKVKGKNPDLYRLDDHDNIIYKHSYGKNSTMGWEIDHKNPKANRGSEHMKNKQPLQTNTNRQKSDKYPFKKPSNNK